MQRARILRACTRKVRIQKGQRAELTDLPFAAGSEVEVIVVGPEPKKVAGSKPDIYKFTASLTRRKKIPRYSMRQIEDIIHESRQSRD
jgi:hypothetical protein